MSCYDTLAVLQYFLEIATTPEREVCMIRLAQGLSWNLPTLKQYVGLFGMTCCLEAIVYMPYFLWLSAVPFGLKKGVLTVLALNLATHPLFVFAWASFAKTVGLSRGDYLGWGEMTVAVTEGVLVMLIGGKIGLGTGENRRMSFVRALALATLANLWSWNVGVHLLS